MSHLFYPNTLFLYPSFYTTIFKLCWRKNIYMYMTSVNTLDIYDMIDEK